ncbi:MAG: hypothetical protein PUG64_02340 [Bacteroidales bacterium]|nr:hypothetical protein [Bacteroidales bacterium]MDY3912775.1 hypothetical protein [Sodaliphilus sp.]
MKSTLRLLTIAAVALMALLGATACGGRGGALDKAIRSAMISGDTTRKAYDGICKLIKDNPDKYAAYLTDGGQINVEELAKKVTEVGHSLRPPVDWDITRYGAASLTLTVYFERSGSMVPYDSRSGGGQLKAAVNDLINAFPSHSAVKINIVNDNIYPYSGTVDSFLQDRDIYASTAGTGDASHTDFKLIFDKIIGAQPANNVSILVTDMIYSPADTRDVSVEKIFHEENGVAASIFRNHNGKSVIVSQLMGDYDGKYYPYNGQPFDYHGKRPFYLIVIADAKTIDQMAADPAYAAVVHPAAAVNTYRFNQGEAQVAFKVIPDWKDNAGRFRVSHDDPHLLTGCTPDRTTGKLRFSLAANLGALQKDAAFFANGSHFAVRSLNGFDVAVRPIVQSDLSANNKAYLDGMTHIITLTGKMTSPQDDVTISIDNDFPQWITASTATDDTNPSASGFATTTFGLDSFMRGIYSAFAGGNTRYYTKIELKLKN